MRVFPYFEAAEIEMIFANRYKREISIGELFWENNYMNDSCKLLNVKDGLLDYSGDELAVCEIINELSPDVDYAVIDLTW